MFEWMRAALNGPGALGASGFFPGKGSPVVLDLGAVSQVSSLMVCDVGSECFGRNFDEGAGGGGDVWLACVVLADFGTLFSDLPLC